MNKILTVIFVIVATSAMAFAQVSTFENFDNLRPDTLFAQSKDAVCRIDASAEQADKNEGAAAMRLRAVLPSANSWGAYTQIGHKNHDPLFDWSNSDTLTLWVKVTMAPTHPEAMSFRLQVTEYNGGDQGEVWVFQNNSILDAAQGWVKLKIPLVERMPADGSLSPDSTGFCIAPATWGWPPFINKKFDADKITTWYLTQLTIVDVADSVEVLYDNFQQTGTKGAPVTIFNGKAFTGIVSGDPWAWGSSSVNVEIGAGFDPGLSNAVKWTQGTNPGWGADSGYTGWGVDMLPTNLSGNWLKDTLKFKMKAAAEDAYPLGDSIRVQIEDGVAKKGKVLDLIADGNWHDYLIPLTSLEYQEGTSNFDSTKVTKFGIMAQKSGRVGRQVFITKIWVGNPDIDVVPPVAPTGVFAIGGSLQNIITWTDVPNEAGATYNVFYSENAFTSVDEPGVEDLPTYKIASGVQAHSHLLRYPLVDNDVTYFYGVAATDAAGNTGAAGVSPASVTTKAKGVATIALAPPASVAIDGNLSEWASSGIKPVIISVVPATGQGHVQGSKIDGDADLKVLSYLATDANNLYIAFDVDDDVVGKTNDSIIYYTKGTYGVDGCDLFIGLYDWRGMRHRGYEKGAEPDYHFRFTRFGALLDNNGKYLNGGAGEYKWKEKTGLQPGYTIEAKIPFKMLADSLGADIFVPKEGMKIPLDYSINDNDDTNPTGDAGAAREGIICYGPLNNDNAWNAVWQWSHTWIGAKWSTGVQKDKDVVATTFELSQNYPNPFNPTTNIRFSIPKAGLVSLKVYDVLGREVMDVMNEYQEAGSYTVSLDASKLATGMYVYRLESGSFASTKKMMFVK